jgi:hypothetical protein
MSPTRIPLAAAALLLAAGVAAAQPATVTKTMEGVATVEAIDTQTREVVLSNGDEIVTLKVGPEVHNLAQVHPGDKVRVSYGEQLAAQMAKPGSPPVTAAEFAGRTKPGAKPGALAGRTMTARVKIVSVDKTANTVTFTGPAGHTQEVAVRDPGMQAFIAKLNPGDEVDVTYTEAIAINVTPQ